MEKRQACWKCWTSGVWQSGWFNWILIQKSIWLLGWFMGGVDLTGIYRRCSFNIEFYREYRALIYPCFIFLLGLHKSQKIQFYRSWLASCVYILWVSAEVLTHAGCTNSDHRNDRCSSLSWWTLWLMWQTLWLMWQTLWPGLFSSRRHWPTPGRVLE